MVEMRRPLRQRALKTGKIIVNSGGSVFDCLIRNVSDTGALLEIESSLGIPDSFGLVIGEAPQERARQVRVVRRQATRLGVAFD
jgi:hypothetical protein